MTLEEFANGMGSIFGFIFNDEINIFGIPLWTLLIGATIFLAVLKFIKGKGSGG